MRAHVACTIFFAYAAFGQSAVPLPKFDASEVHRSENFTNPYTYLSGGVLRGERYDLRKATMLDLIRLAYDFPAAMIVGGPNWLEFDRFDIAAKAAPNTSPGTVKLMLQSLLADRFKLVVHKDTRLIPAFGLTVGKDKPKLIASTGTGDPECIYQQTAQRQSALALFTVYYCRHMTMSQFAEQVRGLGGDYLTDTVIDATGIEGEWDFDLRWNQRSQVLPAGMERTTIFTAVEKQLGLALTSQKAPAPVLVIDRVNEKPTDNVRDIAQLLPRREVEFEVASLKPSRRDAQGELFQATAGGGLEATNVELRVLMGAAWDMDWDHVDDIIVGLPKSIASMRFDISAKPYVATNAPPLNNSGYIADEIRLMLRNLLIERFKMKTHYEDRAVKAYSLVAAKPKLKKADPANRGSCKDSRTIANDPRDQNPRLSRMITCENATVAQFAAQLQRLDSAQFAYPVEDATGISGSWDFTLNFTPSWIIANLNQATGSAADPSDVISLEDAINKQMGLRLIMRKRNLPVVVIDHMEETPTEN